MKKIFKKIFVTSLVTGAISLITIPLASKKQNKNADNEEFKAEQLLDNDQSPLFI